MNRQRVLSKSAGIFFIRLWICFKSYYFFMQSSSSHLALGTSLRKQNLSVSTKLFLLISLARHTVQSHKITDCFQETSCRISDVFPQRHSAANHSLKQLIVLSVLFENILHLKRFCLQESFVFCKVLSRVLLQHNRQNYCLKST